MLPRWDIRDCHRGPSKVLCLAVQITVRHDAKFVHNSFRHIEPVKLWVEQPRQASVALVGTGDHTSGSNLKVCYQYFSHVIYTWACDYSVKMTFVIPCRVTIAAWLADHMIKRDTGMRIIKQNKLSYIHDTIQYYSAVRKRKRKNNRERNLKKRKPIWILMRIWRW